VKERSVFQLWEIDNKNTNLHDPQVYDQIWYLNIHRKEKGKKESP
jgi:hypothetical protein